MSDPNYFREHCLIDVLASKHYPQVFQVTRPYFLDGKECLKKGQYIAVLQRRKVELITGIDQEGRFFKVRKDRQTNVEVLEEERIVYSLSVVAEVAEHIEAVEFRKEIRLDKNFFEVGERFTVEKVGKSFRGRTKNLALRRQRDGKVHKFPLDVIGMFKLHTGRTLLPLSRILALRAPPLRVQFMSNSLSSNFPPGIVTLEDSALCDIVYILTVTKGVYQYEVFVLDSDVFVKRTDLKLPKPIRAIIPCGVYINSNEYSNVMKAAYKQKLAEIDSKVIEHINANSYYGSASIAKNPNDDSHLILRVYKPGYKQTCLSSTIASTKSTENLTSTIAAMQSKLCSQGQSPIQSIPFGTDENPNSSLSHSVKPSEFQLPAVSSCAIQGLPQSPRLTTSTNSTPKEAAHRPNPASAKEVIETQPKDNRPSPMPRYSKKARNRVAISFPAIKEFETHFGQLARPTSLPLHKTSASHVDDNHNELSDASFDAGDADSVFGSECGCSTPTDSQLSSPTDSTVDGVLYQQIRKSSFKVESLRSRSSQESLRSRSSQGSNSSNRIFYSPDDDQEKKESTLTKDSQQANQMHSWNINEKFYESPSILHELVPSGSSVATEDSGDSGVVLSFPRKSHRSRVDNILPRRSPLSHPQTKEPAYEDVVRFSQPTIVKVDIDIDDQDSPPPIIERHRNFYQNMNVVRHEISKLNADDSVQSCHTEHAYEELPYQNLKKIRKGSGHNSLPIISQCSQNRQVSHARNIQRQQEIAMMGQAEIGRLLTKLNLQRYIECFAKELINGTLLLELEEETLHHDLGMTRFESRKLYKYVLGWRPNINDVNESKAKGKPEDWSVGTVVKELQKINSPKLATFCYDNDIDGALLKDLIEHNLVKTLKSDHNVVLSGIELSRLKAYILKEWRPDSATGDDQTENISTVNSETRRPHRHSLDYGDSLVQTDVQRSERLTKSTADLEQRHRPVWSKIVQT